jgi:hypothetical protein
MGRPRKEGPLLRCRNGVYYGTVYVAGEPVERSTGERDEAEAARVVAGWTETAAQVAQDRRAEESSPTLNDVLSELIADRKAKVRDGDRSMETVSYYEKRAGTLLAFFGHDFRVSAWSTDSKASWDFIGWRRETASDRTIKKELGTLRTALNIAKEQGRFAGDTELVATTKRGVFELSEEVQKAGGHIGELGKGFLKVLEPTEVMRHAVEGVSEGVKTLASGLKSGEAKEAVEGISESLAAFASTLDLVVPGLGQVASAAVKAGGAFVSMSVGIAQAAVEMGLEVTAVNDKLTATFDALGSQGPNSGKKTLEFLDGLSKKLPQSRDQLAQWTKQYEALGITDFGELRQQITATASAQAILGDQGAETYTNLTKKVQEAVEAHHGLKLSEKTLTQLYSAGVNVTDVADRMGISTKKLTAGLKAGTVDAQAFGNALSDTLIEKGKKPLEAMGDELSTLKQKGLETLNHLFDGIDPKPLTDAIKSVIDLGDQGEPSGQALKKGVTSGVNAIIRALGAGITKAEIFFLRLELRALELELKLKPVIRFLERIGVLSKNLPGGAKAEPSDGLTDLQRAFSKKDYGAIAKESLETGLKTTAYNVLGGPVIGAFQGIGSAISDALDIGMLEDMARVKAAGAALGHAAITGAKEKLDAHSPSRVAMRLGVNLSEGFAGGIAQSSNLPARESRRMASTTCSAKERARSWSWDWRVAIGARYYSEPNREQGPRSS